MDPLAVQPLPLGIDVRILPMARSSVVSLLEVHGTIACPAGGISLENSLDSFLPRYPATLAGIFWTYRGKKQWTGYIPLLW